MFSEALPGANQHNLSGKVGPGGPIFMSIPKEAYFERRVIRTGPNGEKEREVFAPSDRMIEIQNLLVRTLRPYLYGYGIAVGGMPGMKLADNLIPHQQSGGYHYGLFDVADAYQSVNLTDLAWQLQSLRVQTPVAGNWREILPHIAGHPDGDHDGLILGPNAAPMLFNFYMNSFDWKLHQLCRDNGLTATRWIDDITISSPKDKPGIGRGTRKLVQSLLSEQGMELRHKKSEYLSLERGPVNVTAWQCYQQDTLNSARLVLFGFYQSCAISNLD
jgi:hypothetical protein